MKRKVIYVSVGRLTDKIARDWYIDYLIEKGVRVEYWDVVSLVREEHAEKGARHPDFLHVFRTFGEVERMLRLPANRDSLYVMLITYAGQFTRIFRIFSKYGCRMLMIAWGAMPRDPVYKWRKIASALANPAWCAKVIFYRCKATALRRLKLVKPFDIIFAAGEVLMAGSHFAAKVVPINLCDYDHYVKARAAGGRLFEGRYSVFLDVNLPYQSDLAFCGYPQIDAGRYFRSLNRFFGLLERQYGLKVVIAAHPKADYDAATFEGRPIHRLVTAEAGSRRRVCADPHQHRVELCGAERETSRLHLYRRYGGGVSGYGYSANALFCKLSRLANLQRRWVRRRAPDPRQRCRSETL